MLCSVELRAFFDSHLNLFSLVSPIRIKKMGKLHESEFLLTAGYKLNASMHVFKECFASCCQKLQF